MRDRSGRAAEACRCGTNEWYRYNDLQLLHLFESEQWKLKI